MEITTVKYTADGGFIANGMIIPNEEGNRHYRMVQEWIAEGGVVEPFETAAEAAAREVVETNAKARAYLASTDWYVTRFTESGVAIPTAIQDARTKARASVI